MPSPILGVFFPATSLAKGSYFYDQDLDFLPCSALIKQPPFIPGKAIMT
jgi:hypothetical protein